ncbi:hypothetical protein BDZ85DRAFT_234114 [Elsinoe ampelina]|uniref:Allergen n=1 Tax=Elsinoe ampelina TaxID=302913 RepID=A0A6A6GE44_9PEZI|nr:hypothetical protein BDZ85DRAFT_234114 [Elsinoe ampelina]
MDKAKTGVMDFLHKHGKHDTSVHETVNPAVTNETVHQHRHDNVVTAKDKEVHQDHYHTTVQPVHDEKRLPEQHHFNTAPVEHRNFEHGNDQEVESRLTAEREKFKDTTVKGDTKHTSTTAEPVVGEHIHHHVHENIQPVVNRQTVEPHVVHTTIPIHEVHHSAAQHHSTSALPAMSMADFKKSGGTLGGREQKNDFFEGEPRSMHGHNPLSDNASSEFRQTGHGHSKHDSATTGVIGGVHDANGTGVTGADHTTTTKKPSLLDRLNPMKDADGDGKKGIMN